jgi:hypothetical protein
MYVFEFAIFKCFYISDRSYCSNLEPNRTETLMFGAVRNSKLARKKIEPNYQAYYTVRKSNLKIFVEPDLLATIVRKPNICTILQGIFGNKNW